MVDCTNFSPNFLSPFGFQLILDKIPSTKFFIQRARVPGLSLGKVSLGTPFVANHEAGNLQFGEFSIDFIINESLDSYLDIQAWMFEKGNPESFDTFKSDKYDGSLVILSNNKVSILEVKFTDIWPNSLTDIDFDSTLTEPTPIIATATFSFDNMSYHRL